MFVKINSCPVVWIRPYFIIFHDIFVTQKHTTFSYIQTQHKNKFVTKIRRIRLLNHQQQVYFLVINYLSKISWPLLSNNSWASSQSGCTGRPAMVALRCRFIILFLQSPWSFDFRARLPLLIGLVFYSTTMHYSLWIFVVLVYFLACHCTLDDQLNHQAISKGINACDKSTFVRSRLDYFLAEVIEGVERCFVTYDPLCFSSKYLLSFTVGLREFRCLVRSCILQCTKNKLFISWKFFKRCKII